VEDTQPLTGGQQRLTEPEAAAAAAAAAASSSGSSSSEVAVTAVFEGCSSLTFDVSGARNKKAGLGKGIDTPHKLIMLCVRTVKQCSSTTPILDQDGREVLALAHASKDRDKGVVLAKIRLPDGTVLCSFGRGPKPLPSMAVKLMGGHYGSFEMSSRPRVFQRAGKPPGAATRAADV
jgi:hypothetical protein